MAGRRFCYCLALAGCGVFYLMHGEWFSWVLLLGVLGLPWLSLVLSLGAMITFRADTDCPRLAEQGCKAQAWLVGESAYPLPPFRGRLRLCRCFTGETARYQWEWDLPTEHCGGILVQAERCRVYDYLGLFSVPARHSGCCRMIVLPKPVPMEVPDPEGLVHTAWKIKPGGGFGENHELRLYRPGDSMNQVHWKLTAKTGKLTIREPMEPVRGLVLVTLTLRGSPEELDRKLGRLLWLGTHLTDRGIAFEIRALTGEGIHCLPVENQAELSQALNRLLCTPLAREGSLRGEEYAAAWRCHIGGEANEP